MAAGFGWIGGTFPFPGSFLPAGLGITVAHLVPITVIVALIPHVAGPRCPSPKARVGLTVLAVAVKAVTVGMIAWAVTHPSPAALGPHTVLEWVPIGMLNAGTGLWLLHVIRTRVPGPS